jgi:hypothetical protein
MIKKMPVQVHFIRELFLEADVDSLGFLSVEQAAFISQVLLVLHVEIRCMNNAVFL